MNEIAITDEKLEALRQRIFCELEAGRMSEKRYRHICEVEKMTERLCDIYLPEKKRELCAAALLHDLTKEYSHEAHKAIFEKYSIELCAVDAATPKVWHAMSASAIIPDEFPEYAAREVIDAVRWHTTGRAGMTLCEKLVYLADYIDMSRTFEDCVKLRRLFFCEGLDDMSYEDKLLHLDQVLLCSFDMTISSLLESTMPVSRETSEARNDLLLKIKQKTNK